MTFEEAIQNIKKWLACINRDDLDCLKVCDSCQNHVDAVTLYESLTVIVADAKKKTDEDKQLTKWLEELIERRKQQSERKKGKWIKNDNGTYSCSLCHSWIPEEQHYYAQFCLYCGADMRGEQHETN